MVHEAIDLLGLLYGSSDHDEGDVGYVPIACGLTGGEGYAVVGGDDDE